MKVIPVAGHDSMLLNIGGAHNAYFTRNIVVLTDNAGHTGIGEAPGGDVIYQTLVDAIPMVLGQEVARLNKVVQQVHKGNQAADFDTFGKGAWTFELRVNAVAALEAALLDLLGKALNVPVCELLGPGKQREAITVLGYLFYIGDRTKTDLPYVENTPGTFTVPAFAYADDTEQELPVTEATQPEATPETAAPEEPEQYEGEPIDGEGNAYTRDLLYDKATNKQFITVQTKTGNTFYVVIDYDAPINEEEEQYQTYFLNMVDEADLLALLDEETASSLTTCNCDTRCEAGAVNTECPVCKTNMSECAGAVPEPEEPVEDAEAEAPEEPENASPNIALIIGIIALVGIGGGAYYYFKFVRGKKQKDEDLDFFDDEGYEEEPYINEDEEPVIADDEDDGDETKETEETI